MSQNILGTLSKGLVIILSAPAGTGKTTLARMLVSEFSCVTESISCTTRPKRPGEIADKDYHFLSKKEFEEKLAANAFLEHAEVFDYAYGTLEEDVNKLQKQGQHVLLVIDTQGAMELKKKGYPAIFIFIQPPSLVELRKRLFHRKADSEEHIAKRLQWAEKEISMAPSYDYTVVNDNLHHAYEVLRSILIAEEHKTMRYHDRHINQ